MILDYLWKNEFYFRLQKKELWVLYIKIQKNGYPRFIHLIMVMKYMIVCFFSLLAPKQLWLIYFFSIGLFICFWEDVCFFLLLYNKVASLTCFTLFLPWFLVDQVNSWPLLDAIWTYFACFNGIPFNLDVPDITLTRQMFFYPRCMLLMQVI